MEIKNPPDWFTYIPLKWVPAKRFIDPANLTQHQRQTLWSGIKKSDPALADLLTKDPVFAELKRIFNGTTVFEIDEFNRFIQAGQKGEGK